jgi:HEPN domain-containing protein
MNILLDPEKSPNEWLKKADDDLRAATQLIRLTDDCPLEIVCFHVQQCIEKSIKAVLIHREIDFPKIHDIGKILSLLPSDVLLPIDVVMAETLTVYATTMRYPGDWGPVEREEAAKAVDLARRIRNLVDKIVCSSLP